MALAADDDVVVDGDAEGLRHVHDLARHRMSAEEGVGSPEGWLWTRIRAVAESSSARLHHLARIDRRVVDGAGLLHLVGDQRVALVEEQQAELLACRMKAMAVRQ